MRYRSILPLALAALLLPGARDGAFNAEGYRIAHYRAPTRPAPAGAPRIATAAAAGLWRDRQALFIDVLPAEGAFADPRTGRWRLAASHSSIPGAHWFPGAGFGALTPDKARWFETGIARLTGGRKDRTLVVFCLADCWMSWNAARRLIAEGYSAVWWLADGTDGWHEAGLPLAPVRPETAPISRF